MEEFRRGGGETKRRREGEKAEEKVKRRQREGEEREEKKKRRIKIGGEREEEKEMSRLAKRGHFRDFSHNFFECRLRMHH